MKMFKIEDYYVNSIQITFIREPVIKRGLWTIGTSDGARFNVRSDNPVMAEIQHYFRIEDPK